MPKKTKNKVSLVDAIEEVTTAELERTAPVLSKKKASPTFKKRDSKVAAESESEGVRKGHLSTSRGTRRQLHIRLSEELGDRISAIAKGSDTPENTIIEMVLLSGLENPSKRVQAMIFLSELE